MENLGGFSQTMRKKRSDRRPRNDIQTENGNSSLSSSPPSNNGSKGLSDDNVGNSSAEIAPNVGSEFGATESSDDKEAGGEIFESNYKETSDGQNSGSLEVDNVVKKVKLKVGGVIRTIHAKPSSDVGSKSSILKPPHSNRLKHAQEHPDQEKGSGLRGIPWKDFSRSGFSVGKVDSSKGKINKFVPKRRLLNNNNDEEEEEDEDDAELRYLAKMKLKSAKVVVDDDEDIDEGGSKKQRKISSVLKMDVKKTRKSEDTDYTGEELQTTGDVFVEDSRKEMTVTTRRKALHSSRDVSSDSTASVVEFPHGLPPAPSRKQKDKLTEVEHQLKKAEAAQRRKLQAAKAARESEAEAIRKILGQDSSRKKRENKMKQRQDELAQERISNAATLASNTVRWVIGPTRTVVTFSDDIGLPNIFESRTCSYPPPREKCAGPSCSKPFKYRDSRSKLPLCSLQCYNAVQQKLNVC